MERIAYTVDGKLARVAFNRPHVKNAQSGQLLRELDAAFERASADPAVRVIILSGKGDSFSAGHDLGTPEQVDEREARTSSFHTNVEDRFDYSWEHFVQFGRRWRDIPKPTIAQVHGWCIFGGWLIASTMDLIVAADDTRFLTNLLQYFTLPYDVGPRKAKEILFDNKVMTAAEAADAGFVNRVVPRARLADEVTALASRIAQQPPFVLRAMKLAVNNAQDAMGFQSSLLAAHSHYMLSEQSSLEWRRQQGGPDTPKSLVRHLVDPKD